MINHKSNTFFHKRLFGLLMGSDSNLRLFYDRLNKQIHININILEVENGSGQLSVIGMEGKKNESELYNGNDYTVSTNKMKAGVYIINVISTNKMYNRKLIVY